MGKGIEKGKKKRSGPFWEREAGGERNPTQKGHPRCLGAHVLKGGWEGEKKNRLAWGKRRGGEQGTRPQKKGGFFFPSEKGRDSPGGRRKKRGRPTRDLEAGKITLKTLKKKKSQSPLGGAFSGAKPKFWAKKI